MVAAAGAPLAWCEHRCDGVPSTALDLGATASLFLLTRSAPVTPKPTLGLFTTTPSYATNCGADGTIGGTIGGGIPGRLRAGSSFAR